MERKYKIAIPEPCHEDWNKMKPKENGRFCMSCSKTVVDFSSMLPEEIQHFFVQNQNEQVCGRFRKSQLDSIIIQIPHRILYEQTNYYKMFLLALFVTMGTTLFSCEDKNGNKNKIDKIEVVDNLSQNQEDNENVSSCYGHQIESKKAKTKKSEEKIHSFTTGIVVPRNFRENGSFEYHIVYNQNDLDALPFPKNGMKKFYSYFEKKFTPSKKGEMSILFVVEQDGTLSNFKVTKNTSSQNEKEVVKVLESAPEWIPGKINNRIVRSTYVLPITFK